MYRKGMPFTQEDILQAKNIDLVGYLQSCGTELTRKGRYYSLKEHDSLVINPATNGWHWNSQSLHGRNAVDFLMAYDNLTFPEAVAELLGKSLSPPSSSDFHRATNSPDHSTSPDRLHGVFPPEEQELHSFILPPRNTDMHRLYAYLTKTRCIDAEVVTHFVHNKDLYEDDHHNCVFVGRDEQQKPVYGFRRGTLTENKYEGDCPDSDKRFNFCHIGKVDRLFVFEATIDLMSYLTLHPDWDSSYLALGGLNDTVLAAFLVRHPSTARITLCLDSDVPGIVAADRMRRKYQHRYAADIASPGGTNIKDWNDRLVWERTGVQPSVHSSNYKGRTDTLVVFRRPEDVRHYLAYTGHTGESLLLTNNPEMDIPEFQKSMFKERQVVINNIKPYRPKAQVKF